MRQKLQQKQTSTLQLRRAIIAGSLLLLVVTPLVVLYIVKQPTSSEGQPAGGSGPSGNALDFDGNDDYVSTSCSINFSQSSGNSYTFSAWVKLDATDGSTGQIVCSDDKSFDWSILKAKKKNEWEMFVGTPANNTTISSGVSTDKKWHFITGVFDHNADEARMYVDGILEVTGDLGYGTTDSSIHIGRNPHRGFEFFDGKIDEVRIWSEARTQQEIRDLMHQELDNPKNKSNLVAYYDFNNTSNGLTDRSGNNNDGTLKNGPTSVSSGARIGIQHNAKYTNVDGSNVNSFGLTSSDGDGVEVDITNGSADALKVIEVDGGPSSPTFDNSNLSGGKTIAQMSQERYWIVHPVNPTSSFSYTFQYNYDGHPGFSSSNESDLRLVERADFAAQDWDARGATPNTTATPKNITLSGLNGNHIGLATTNSNSPLPVELTSFTVRQKSSRSARLEWATASETNNKHFLVQRRRGDQWQQVGQVEGHGTTIEPQEYGFTDNGLTSGTHYYRLKQVDFDGSYEYSDVKAVTISAEGQQDKGVQLQLYPNPVSNQLTLEVTGKKEAGRYQLRIRHSSGRLVHRRQLTGSQAQVAVSDWQPGAYVLMLKGNGQTYQKRFIKR
jgi:hypothetical protein